MRLTLQSRTMEDVVVIRCRGRIVAGTEAEALQIELDRQTQIPGTNVLTVKCVVLHLAEVDYIDSSGLGTLLRILAVLRAAGGSLKLCQVSPIVLQVLEVTKLQSLLTIHSSEEEAIEAFYTRSPHEPLGSSRTRIMCIDTSRDLLAYVRADLTSSGYEVHTASNPADAKILVGAIKPKVVICGAGMLGLPTGAALVEGFRQKPNMQILRLPSDFSTVEAGQAGIDLLNRVQSLLTI